MLGLALNKLLLLALNIVFLLAVVRHYQFVHVFDKFLHHSSLESLEAVGQEVVARFDIFVSAELNGTAEARHALIDVVLDLRIPRLCLREKNDDHIL